MTGEASNKKIFKLNFSQIKVCMIASRAPKVMAKEGDRLVGSRVASKMVCTWERTGLGTTSLLGGLLPGSGCCCWTSQMTISVSQGSAVTTQTQAEWCQESRQAQMARTNRKVHEHCWTLPKGHDTQGELWRGLGDQMRRGVSWRLHLLVGVQNEGRESESGSFNPGFCQETNQYEVMELQLGNTKNQRWMWCLNSVKGDLIFMVVIRTV